MIKLDFIDAGSGHRNAATALKRVIDEQRRPWDVRLVNLQEVLEPLDSVKRLTGLRVEEFHNGLLSRGLTFRADWALKLLHLLIRLRHQALLRAMRRFWAVSRPDLVVSLVPNFNRVLFEGLWAVLPGVPYVTVLTADRLSAALLDRSARAVPRMRNGACSGTGASAGSTVASLAVLCYHASPGLPPLSSPRHGLQDARCRRLPYATCFMTSTGWSWCWSASSFRLFWSPFSWACSSTR